MQGAGRQSQMKQNSNVLLVRKIHVVKINSSEWFAAIPHPSCLLQRTRSSVYVQHDV